MHPNSQRTQHCSTACDPTRPALPAYFLPQIAVLKEMDCRGPFSALVMGVVVLKDVLVILAFALNIQAVPSILGTGRSAGAAALGAPLLSLAASVSVGLVGGLLLSLVLEHQVSRGPPRALVGLAAGLLLLLLTLLLVHCWGSVWAGAPGQSSRGPSVSLRQL
jgi:hypothetical protein